MPYYQTQLGSLSFEKQGRSRARLLLPKRIFMDIKRAGAQPSAKGPADWFTGAVRVDPLFSPPDPARVSGALVTFEPGARTAWYTHPLGQTLICHRGLRLGGARGRPDRGNPAQRCRLVSTRREAPARRGGNHGHEPYRDPGKVRRQERRVDGESQRRAIPPMSEERGPMNRRSFLGSSIVLAAALTKGIRSWRIHPRTRKKSSAT